MSAEPVAYKPYAKLFETSMGQILVKRDSHDETSKPEVRFFFDARHLGYEICSSALTFPDSEGGERAADTAFDGVTQEGAENLVAKILKDLPALRDSEGNQE